MEYFISFVDRSCRIAVVNKNHIFISHRVQSANYKSCIGALCGGCAHTYVDRARSTQSSSESSTAEGHPKVVEGRAGRGRIGERRRREWSEEGERKGGVGRE